MSEIVIRCRNNGPYVVEGAVKVVDAQGNSFPIPSDKPAIALCRCGQSARRPFCDGTHNKCGFTAAETAPST